MTPPDTPEIPLGFTLDNLHISIDRVADQVVPEEETADTVGRLRFAESRLADIRRALLSEFAGEQRGEQYQLVTGRTAKRSFDGQQILRDVLATDPYNTMAGVLLALRDYGALRFTWQWSKLKQFMHVEGIELKLTAHEISDGGMEGHVGEVWEHSTRLEAIKEDD